MKSVLAPLRVHMSAKNVITRCVKWKQVKSNSTMSDMELDLDVQSMLDGSYHPLIESIPFLMRYRYTVTRFMGWSPRNDGQGVKTIVVLNYSPD